MERRIRRHAHLEPRTHGAGAGARELEKGGRAEALGVARVHPEALAQREGEPGARVEAVVVVDHARRASEPIGDVVPQPVPARRDGENERGARDERVADERERVLRVRPDRVLRVRDVRRERAPAREHFERPAPDVVAGVLHAGDEHVAPAGQRARVRRLDRPARGEGAVDEPGVVRDEVHVELLGVERPHERVEPERQMLAEPVLAVQRRQVQLGRPEVARREVPPRMTARLALGQRARLGDVVVRVLVREGQIGPAEIRADLGEGPRRTAAREVAVAVVARVGERERPVERASRASETKA